MRFESIASGSSGNCIYIGSDTTHLLIDVGISRKRTADALKDLDLDLKDINGIFLTHEHSDHITGLPIIAKKTDMPIYATEGTISEILRMSRFQEIDPGRFIPVRADEKVIVGDLTVDPMRISHDAAEPVGYRVRYGSKKACVCTDLGCYSDYTVECLKDSDVVLIEANHDVNMLLFLGHLSQENNLPELAYETVRVELMDAESNYRAEDLPIHVADRKKVSGLVEF